MWYNYHAQVKRLILEGRMTGYQFMDSYNEISPALVIYFKNHRPMPIRDYMWQIYLPYLQAFDDEDDI